MNKLNKFLFFSGFAIFSASIAKIASAVCPVCVVAVGAGLGLSRFFGVDDTVSSMWIGALLAALSIWTIIWLVKKGWGFKYQKIVIPGAYYLFTLLPLWYYDIMGHPLNTIFGIDKILFGSIFGTAVFLASVWLHNYLKQKNNGKSYFPYQKVVLPVVILLIFSIILWIII
jgi:hypothetical protein